MPPFRSANLGSPPPADTRRRPRSALLADPERWPTGHSGVKPGIRRSACRASHRGSGGGSLGGHGAGRPRTKIGISNGPSLPWQPTAFSQSLDQGADPIPVNESGKAWFGSALFVRGFAENPFAELNGYLCNLRVKLGQIIGPCLENPVGRIIDDPARIHERASARL